MAEEAPTPERGQRASPEGTPPLLRGARRLHHHAPAHLPFCMTCPLDPVEPCGFEHVFVCNSFV